MAPTALPTRRRGPPLLRRAVRGVAVVIPAPSPMEGGHGTREMRLCRKFDSIWARTDDRRCAGRTDDRRCAGAAAGPSCRGP